MRSIIALSLFAAAASLALPAAADVGPPPSCPAGTHREYLYGHRCVKDGFHLEQDANGNPREVSDAPPVAPSASASSPEVPSATATVTPSPSTGPGPTTTGTDPATPTATPTSTASAAATSVPENPPAKRGCACDLPGGHGSIGAIAGGLAAAGVLLAFGTRRRPRVKLRRRH